MPICATPGSMLLSLTRQERKAAEQFAAEGAGPRVDAGRMDPVVQPRRPRQTRRALHSGPQPARPRLAPARSDQRAYSLRRHPHHRQPGAMDSSASC